MQEAIDLSQIEAVIAQLSDDDRQKLEDLVAEELEKPFTPNPGPQTEALNSKADILLYGGAAGGGKSALEVGCAILNHSSSMILRREATQLDGLIEFSRELIGDNGSFNGQDKEWKLDDGRTIKFGGLPQPNDWRKYAGRARDLFCFDEAGEFLESQVFSLIAWLRTVKEGQRCRVILGSNPPRGGDGDWMLTEFAPWLEPGHPFAAAPGELRWAVRAGGKTEWVEGPGEYETDGETYTAMSRTFIPARLDDNPYLKDTNYRATLQNLEEPLRSQLLHGDFLAGRIDHEWQLIPSDWVKAAQDRWENKPPEHAPMTAIGVDVAQGGADQTVLAPRYDAWFAPLTTVPGVQTPTGREVAGLVISHRQNRATIVLDMGGGWGGATYEKLRDNGMDSKTDLMKYVGAAGSSKRTQDQTYSFHNVRDASYWLFKEALDPSQDGGSQIALPPDPELYADLTAPRYSTKSGKIKIEAKDDIKKRLGRSPDKGDAVVMAWWGGPKLITHGNQWRGFAKQTSPGGKPKVIMGRKPLTRRR